MSTNTVRYLYRYTDGHWHISDTLGAKGKYIRSKIASDSPFTVSLEWKYYDKFMEEWDDDDSLKISSIDGTLGERSSFDLVNLKRDNGN